MKLPREKADWEHEAQTDAAPSPEEQEIEMLKFKLEAAHERERKLRAALVALVETEYNCTGGADFLNNIFPLIDRAREVLLETK